MKIISKVLAIFFVVCSILAGTGIGYLTRDLVVNYLYTPWINIPLPKPPDCTMRILGITIGSNLFMPNDDVIYIQTKSGNIYAHKNYYSGWSEIDQESFHQITAKYFYANDHEDQSVPKNLIIIRKVADMEKIIFDRPLSTISRVYLLYADGHMNVRIRSQDVYTLFLSYLVSMILGMMSGFIIGLLIWVKISKKYFQKMK